MYFHGVFSSWSYHWVLSSWNTFQIKLKIAFLQTHLGRFPSDFILDEKQLVRILDIAMMVLPSCLDDDSWLLTCNRFSGIVVHLGERPDGNRESHKGGTDRAYLIKGEFGKILLICLAESEKWESTISISHRTYKPLLSGSPHFFSTSACATFSVSSFSIFFASWISKICLPSPARVETSKTFLPWVLFYMFL